MSSLRPFLPAAVLAVVAMVLPAAPAAATPPYPGLDTQGEARLALGAAFSLSLEKNGDLVLWHEQQGLRKYRVPALSSSGSDLPCYRYQSTMTADGLILLIGYYKGTFTNGDGVPVTREGVKILSDFLGRPGGALVVTDVKNRAADPTRWDGAFYVYIKVDGSWAQQASSPKPDAAAASEQFGYAVALSGGTAVVGAPYVDKYESLSVGAAYVYSVTDTVTPSVSGGNGAVSPSGAQAVPLGDTPAFTFTPDEGYAVDKVLVDGAAVAMTGTNAYTFAPVYADHAISVSFSKLAGPTTVIKTKTHGWSNGPLVILLGSFDGPRAAEADDSTWGGKGMPASSTEYKIGKGRWKLGTRFTVRRQGVTRIYARSSDARGAVGPTAKATVRIDYTTPVVTGYGRPQARTGTSTAFHFKVKDKPTKWVRAMLAVTRYGYPERQYDLGKVPTGREISRRVMLDLGPGTWSWRVVVRDPARNRGLCRWRYLDVSR